MRIRLLMSSVMLSLVVLCTTLIPSSNPKYDYVYWYKGMPFDIRVGMVGDTNLSKEEILHLFETTILPTFESRLIEGLQEAERRGLIATMDE